MNLYFHGFFPICISSFEGMLDKPAQTPKNAHSSRVWNADSALCVTYIRNIHAHVRMLRTTSGFRCNANVKHSNIHPKLRLVRANTWVCESESSPKLHRGRASECRCLIANAFISRPSYHLRISSRVLCIENNNSLKKQSTLCNQKITYFL